VIERLLRIIFAYLAACFVAGLVVAMELMLLGLTMSLLEGRSSSKAPVATSPAYALLWVTWMTSILATIYAFLPASIAITIGEVRRWRSAAFYGGAGVLTAVAAWGIFVSRSLPETTYRWGATPILLASVAGLVGGLVYSRIAGRSAGAWRASKEVP
jgi:hypothetical protein